MHPLFHVIPKQFEMPLCKTLLLCVKLYATNCIELSITISHYFSLALWFPLLTYTIQLNRYKVPLLSQAAFLIPMSLIHSGITPFPCQNGKLCKRTIWKLKQMKNKSLVKMHIVFHADQFCNHFKTSHTNKHCNGRRWRSRGRRWAGLQCFPQLQQLCKLKLTVELPNLFKKMTFTYH